MIAEERAKLSKEGVKVFVSWDESTRKHSNAITGEQYYRTLIEITVEQAELLGLKSLKGNTRKAFEIRECK